MSTRRFILVVVIIMFALAVFGPVLRGYGAERRAAKPDDKPAAKAPALTIDALMRKKLEHAQKLLEGIALADFKKVDDAAGELMTISKLAEFRVLKTPDYDRHANDFRRSLEDIGRGVKARNLEAVTLGDRDM